MPISDTQPDSFIRIDWVSNPQFLLDFVEANGNLCSVGSTDKRITAILNLGWSGKHRLSKGFKEFEYQELTPIVEDYRKSHDIPELAAETKWLLMRYDTGHFFRSHVDNAPGFPRVVSVVVFANEDFSGGELTFDRLGITVKPEAGKVVVFPSCFPYSHSVATVTDGVKYSLVNWYGF